jgi:sarcosine/dimethylglycine N-methyltransferase
MHIADKEKLYRQVHRVLRPGGRLAMREFLAGPAQPIHFPVPWARDAAISFLWPADDVRRLLSAMAFAELAWDDVTAAELERRREASAAAGGAADESRRRLIQGGEHREMQRNLARNFAEGRLGMVQAVFRRD